MTTQQKIKLLDALLEIIDKDFKSWDMLVGSMLVMFPEKAKGTILEEVREVVQLASDVRDSKIDIQKVLNNLEEKNDNPNSN